MVAGLDSARGGQMLAPTKPKVLVGWETIAKYLDVDERTARRWAARETDPLPVGNYGLDDVRVAARVAELDAWRVRRGQNQGRRKSRPIVKDAA